jgi:hypothetical protein
MMRCYEANCHGEVGKTKQIEIGVGESKSMVNPCNVCGRLYRSNNNPVFSSKGNKAFFRDGQFLVIDKNTGEEKIVTPPSIQSQ